MKFIVVIHNKTTLMCFKHPYS